MIFSNVHDIVIPQGNVIKIHETSGGRVLWQKKKTLNPQWYTRTPGEITGNYLTANLVISCLSKSVSYLNNSNRHVMRTCFLKSGKEVTDVQAASPALRWWKQQHGKIPPGVYVLSGGYGTYAESPLSVGYPSIPCYSASDDGSLFFGKYNSDYVLRRFTVNSPVDFITNDPRSETSVFISYSPDRNEYLVTGIKGGTFTLPYSLASSSVVQNGQNLGRSLWANTLNKYFALNNTASRYVYSSSDGSTWEQSQAFSLGAVADIAFLSNKGLLCAINSTTAKIATSLDGLTWNEINVPFSNPLCAAYSNELDLLCVVNNLYAYLSYNLYDWTEVPLSKKVDFRDFIHVKDGIFAGYAYKSDTLYILSALHEVSLDE